MPESSVINFFKSVDLNHSQRHAAEKLMAKFKNLFSRTKGNSEDLTQHQIYIGGHASIRQPED